MKGDWIAGVPGGGTTGTLSTGCGFESCADGGADCGTSAGTKEFCMEGDWTVVNTAGAITGALGGVAGEDRVFEARVERPGVCSKDVGGKDVFL